MAELLGSLLVRLGLESGAFKSGLDASTKQFQAAQKKFQQIGQSMADVGKTMTLGITLPMAAMAAQAVQGAKDQAAAMAQVEAALKSMGGVSGKTAAELAKTADAMEMRSLFDADVILTKVTANLLTFGNVAGEQFDRAQQAAIDMATRMGGDPQNAAIMLGKALNDPIKGITALGRVGVQLTESQKEQIKSFVATGQAAKAQGIILSEVEKQFAGAAQAAADTAPLRQAEVAWNQAMDKIGEAILPVIPVITDAIVAASHAFANLSPEAVNFIVVAGGIAAALGPVVFVMGNIVRLAAPLAAALATSAAATAAAGTAAGGASTGFAALAVAAAPWIAAGAAVAAAGYLIYENWDKIAPVLNALWEAISSTLGPPLQAIVSTLTAMLTELWNGPLGTMLSAVVDGLGKVAAGFGVAFGSTILATLQLAFGVINAGLSALLEVGRAVGSLFEGDVSGAFRHLWQAVNNLFGGLPARVVAWMAQLVTGVRSWLVDRLNAVWDWVIGKVRAVGQAFYNLYDAVVGHSYIPDMVTEIGQHMRRLDQELVAPAKSAASKAEQAFRTLQEKAAAIFSRLFPDDAAKITFMNELATLNAYFDGMKKKGADLLAIEKARLEAVQALTREYKNQHDAFTIAMNEAANQPIETMPGTRSIEDISAEISDRASVVFGNVGKQAETMKVQVIETFGQMVNGAMQELDRFVNGIKSGNWLDIIGGLLSAIEKIGGIISGNSNWDIGSIFGGGSTPPIAGARAAGGPVMAGRPYLVGEEGAEIFRPRVSGTIIPNDQMGGVSHIEITDTTGLFDFRVNGKIIEAAPGVAQAGSLTAQSAMQRSAQRRIG